MSDPKAIADYALVVGIILTVFGWWAISETSDPLGYSPPNAYWPALIGLILIIGGILTKVMS